MSFTLLQTYKVLKPSASSNPSPICFTLLQTYKVLKHVMIRTHKNLVLHSYKLTRFSNLQVKAKSGLTVLHSYKLTRFSNQGNQYNDNAVVLHSYKLTRFSN